MKKDKGRDLQARNSDNPPYVLRLYITGASPNSSKAIGNLTRFCEEHLKSRYELQIIDVYQQPQIAQTVDIIALPLLVKESPPPRKKLIGDMSDIDKISRSLNIAV